jgi:spore germination cell wall hydrolase CwlJ-like protein
MKRELRSSALITLAGVAILIIALCFGLGASKEVSTPPIVEAAEEVIELPSFTPTPRLTPTAAPTITPEPTASPTPTPTPKPKATPSPTPRYGKWDKEDYLLLSTLIYYEAGPSATLESACAVGWVVRNRLEDRSRWGDKTFEAVIYRKNQFTVTKRASFADMLEKIGSLTTKRAENAKQAARYVLQGRDKYRIPKKVQAFHGNGSRRTWGSHEFYAEIGGNAFFYW